ncbi:MAG: GAF domain-containing protein, partial [Myxococcales bacterium]
MNLPELLDAPWPALLVTPDTRLAGCTDALLDLLCVESLDLEALEHGFELRSLEGRPLAGARLPWRRAAAGEEFDEEQLWYLRAECRRLRVAVRARRHPSGAVLWIEDLSRRGLPFELAELVGIVSTGLLQADALPTAVRAVVEQVSRALCTDVVALFTLSKDGVLELQGSSGLPLRHTADGVQLPLEADSALTRAARSGVLQEGSPQDPAAGALVSDLARLGMRSYVAVPLVAWGEIVGVLGLAWRQVVRMPSIELRMLLAVSSASAVALSRAVERDRERRAHERLELLRRASLAVEKALPLHALLEELLAQARLLAGSRRGALGTLSPEGDRLDEIFGDPEAAARLTALASDPVRLRALLRGDDGDQSDRLSVPLRIHGEAFGLFFLTDKRGGAPFSAEDRELVQLYTAHASLMLGYARQLEYIEEQRRLLDAVLQQAPGGIL